MLRSIINLHYTSFYNVHKCLPDRVLNAWLQTTTLELSSSSLNFVSGAGLDCAFQDCIAMDFTGSLSLSMLLGPLHVVPNSRGSSDSP
jgi:hypothetical protein